MAWPGFGSTNSKSSGNTRHLTSKRSPHSTSGPVGGASDPSWRGHAARMTGSGKDVLVESEGATHYVATLRVPATMLLISYHVVGPNETAGMALGYPSGWRIFADALIDVRMPLFAAIAGMVYALRPIALDNLAEFASGRIHRLVVPGVVASIAFWIVCNLIIASGFAYGAGFARTVLLSTGHFSVPAGDPPRVPRRRVGRLDARLPARSPTSRGVAAGGARLEQVRRRRPPDRRGDLSRAVLHARPAARPPSRRDPRSAADRADARHGMLVRGDRARRRSLPGDGRALDGSRRRAEPCARDGRNRPGEDPRGTDRLAGPGGDHTFTILLYHPLGTSTVRRTMEAIDADASVWHFALGFLAGFALPIVLHALADRFGWSRRIVPGLRGRPVAGRGMARAISGRARRRDPSGSPRPTTPRRGRPPGQGRRTIACRSVQRGVRDHARPGALGGRGDDRVRAAGEERIDGALVVGLVERSV